MQFLVRERRGAIAVGVILLFSISGGWLFAIQHQTPHPSPLLTQAPPTDSGKGDPGIIELPAKGDSQTAPSSSSPAAPTLTEPPTVAAKPAPKTITVFVSGAVKRPDVYTFKPGDRIYKAIAAAGGFKTNADQSAINMADELRDADQINVPVRAPRPASPTAAALPTKPHITPGTAKHLDSGVATNNAKDTPPRGRVLGKAPDSVADTPSDIETPAETVVSNVSKVKSRGHSGHSNKFKNPGDGTVNLNKANAEELQKLPGVGPAMSERILEYRKQIGKFDSIEQIRDVKGIGEKKFAKMEPFLKV